MTADDPDSRTGILKAELGENWRSWAWISRQFNKTSLGTIAAILGVAGGWIISLSTKVAEHTTEIRVLKEDVMPDHQVLADVAVLKAGQAEHESRIKRIEDAFDDRYLNAPKQDADRRRR